MELTQQGRRKLAVALAGLAAITALGSAGFFMYPLYTDWQAGRTQNELRAQFQTASFKEDYAAGEVQDASPLTRIIIPAMGTDTIVVEGTSSKALNTGAGHYPNTPLPGEAGNVAIAGHRTTYGKPFSNLEVLQPGDRITLITPFAEHIYEVVEPFDDHANPWVTSDSDWSAVNPTTEPMLTLTTCHPKGSDRQRLIARAKLIESKEIA